mmetsp:Transcript_40322/g.160172  ORF Transcript_40322/g.160172 Transcript_40322/m.160172 type:complete len:245 (-) Transcript_40322:127-861(-)|eukprot:CAMPEP_0113968906 /NCGR_PEP_ID=MMETSP0011_2-20120614/9860_1 /TAXON_ID=101924 /ORGANISM="Rhodosorus marinus" /LENGTH=244 /DNA_ID=CAMNT_0000982181 /DNA_START=155 /DNA_END=889 /DNA_ORIENTATION=- /assembly_acc=CAM_ASM_000156
MDYFTQTVDSSLWASRAFDDEGYEGEESLGELCGMPFELEGVKGTLDDVDRLLLCTDGAPSAFADAVIPPSGVLGTYKSEGVDSVALRMSGNCAVIKFDKSLPPERAFQLSKAIFDTLKPQKVLVLTAMPSWRAQVPDDPELLYFLKSSSHDLSSIEPLAKGGVLPAPTLLEGIGAAVLNECQFRAVPGCALIGMDSSLRLSGISLARFLPAVKILLGLDVRDNVDFAAAAEATFNPAKGNIYI